MQKKPYFDKKTYKFTCLAQLINVLKQECKSLKGMVSLTGRTT